MVWSGGDKVTERKMSWKLAAGEEECVVRH